MPNGDKTLNGVYYGNVTACDHCHTLFKEKQLITIARDGSVFCYSPHGEGCLFENMVAKGEYNTGICSVYYKVSQNGNQKDFLKDTLFTKIISLLT